MQVQLIAHACVLIRTPDVCLLTDPWLHGKAFNDSWALYPAAAPLDVNEVTHLWISHEHPDHFHLPTLRGMPAAWKARVVVLLAHNNSDKMFHAMRRLGFRRLLPLRHRRRLELSSSTAVYGYQQGQINSTLAVQTRECTLLNINDAELSVADCQRIRADLGAVDGVLNQFSVAGYTGEADYAKRLPQQAAGVVASMLRNHRDLGARCTIPFASFMRFSHMDNRYLNAFANTPQDVANAFAQAGEPLAVLYPGDTVDLAAAHAHDSAPALRRFARAQRRVNRLAYDRSLPVPMATLREVFERRCEQLHARFPRLMLRLLQPVVVRLTDAGVCLQISVADRSLLQVASAAPHVELSTEMFAFWWRWPYGLQTVGVSGRYTLHRGFDNWRRYRVLFALDNAELSLRWRTLANRRMLGYAWDRMAGALDQLAHAWGRMGSEVPR